MLGLLLGSGADPLDHVIQHTTLDLNPGGGLWSFPVLSNHIVMQVLAALLLIIVIPIAVRQRAGKDEVGRLVPRGFGNAIEGICVALRNQIFQPNLGKYTDLFSPYLWSVFFFILVSNALGLIPLGDWFSFVPGHLVGGTSTGNIYVTGTLAVATLLMVVINGLRFHGGAYVAHFFMGPPYLAWFIAILEIAGLGFKTMALCVRLCANMLAGHMILAVLGCIAFNFLEILVAFLHAFIFTTLTAVFIGQAVNIHHDHHEEHGHEPQPAGAHH
ncbi:MAG: F0F1 ATP synthase subunit A [Planctomycetes bacterium]|nr:F0F1 ATP synthase subunit A [Planctomycetota bacterium]